LKDYAISLSVNYNENHETFWKWYLTSNDEAKDVIKKILNKKDEVVEKEVEEVPKVVEEKVVKEVEKPIEQPVKEEIIEKPKLLQEIKEKAVSELSGDFINDYFNSKEIYVISQNVVKKGKEINFIVDIPSNLGKLRYFVKYKSKKSISDKDLLDGLKESTAKSLPLLYLSDGNLNVKAQKYVDDNITGQLIFRKL
jgi:hypothetical protein